MEKRKAINLKMKQVILIFLTAVVVVFASTANAQEVKASVKLDTNSILVGDHVGLKLNLEVPENYAFVWPVFADSIAHKVEILRQSKIDTTKVQGFLQVQQTLTLTVFDSGYYVIPPIKFLYGPGKDAINNFVETDPYLLNVFTVPVDTTQAIKPIKGQLKAPYTFAELLPWILLLLVITGAGIFGYYYWKKRKQQVPMFVAKPKLIKLPHQIALDALDELKKQKLWQLGRVKEYHTNLTDIVREYIEKRFNILAIEMTTFEIITSFKGVKLEKGIKDDLQYILELADLVKFAKANPLPSEHDQSMTLAESFVLRTIPPRVFEPPVLKENEHKPETQELTQQSIAKN